MEPQLSIVSTPTPPPILLRMLILITEICLLTKPKENILMNSN